MKKQRYPKIISVEPSTNYMLFVTFDNQIVKKYDCRPILKNPEFHLLKNIAFFKDVRIDAGGRGISWNDNLDLSEYELWKKGVDIN